MNSRRKSCGVNRSGCPAASVRPAPVERVVEQLADGAARRWRGARCRTGAGTAAASAGSRPVRGSRRRRRSGTRRRRSRIRLMIAASTSASSGLMTSSRSVSVLDGAICSSGTSSPVPGSRYWIRLWWDSSVSSSMRMPVWRSDFDRGPGPERRGPPRRSGRGACRCRGPRPRSVPVASVVMTVRRSVCPAAVNGSPGGWPARRRAGRRCAARAASTRDDQHGQHRQPFAGALVHPRLAARIGPSVRARSSARIGQGAAHGAQRAGSSIAHWAMSR